MAEDEMHLRHTIEAILFSLGKAVDAKEIAKACDCDISFVQEQCEELKKEYEESDRGIIIKVFNGKYQMCTRPEYYNELIKIVKNEKKPVLTEVVLETLSIIAYKNPATKVEIEKIRGVKSDHAVNRLIEYGLVEEVGRLDVPGRPALFAPTEAFYQRFGISGKDELPDIDPYTKASIEEETKKEIEQQPEIIIE